MTLNDVLYLLPMGLFIAFIIAAVVIAWIRPDVCFKIPSSETRAVLTIWWLRVGGVIIVLILLLTWLKDWQVVLEQ